MTTIEISEATLIRLAQLPINSDCTTFEQCINNLIVEYKKCQ